MANFTPLKLWGAGVGAAAIGGGIMGARRMRREGIEGTTNPITGQQEIPAGSITPDAGFILTNQYTMPGRLTGAAIGGGAVAATGIGFGARVLGRKAAATKPIQAISRGLSTAGKAVGGAAKTTGGFVGKQFATGELRGFGAMGRGIGTALGKSLNRSFMGKMGIAGAIGGVGLATLGVGLLAGAISIPAAAASQAPAFLEGMTNYNVPGMQSQMPYSSNRPGDLSTTGLPFALHNLRHTGSV